MQGSRFTEEELAIAKSVDLTAIASSLGFTVKRVGRYHTLKEMDSVRIYNRSHWFRWSRQYEKGSYIRDILHTLNYIVLDQTQRGQSATGLQAGEVDLLVCDSEMIPTVIIEALVLDSINTANIKLHIDKVSGYDANGLKKNIILSYVHSADFQDFSKRYKNYIEEADIIYKLMDIVDISNPRFSEIRILTSKFIRSGLDREMLHILVNLT